MSRPNLEKICNRHFKRLTTEGAYILCKNKEKKTGAKYTDVYWI